MKAPEKNAPKQAKKPYRSPVIHYYGDIRTITENIGNSGMVDVGGSGSMKKTLP